ncbi:hypothetical protein CY34DRAFT_153717 [Suillus luteus UH-Slu-Lm8-n1]|uniref:Uncharacterized protein n=1 Tax=Suillus luteus UH-Slu-Lm8-n1 TaxID=930992 RepID=A0A0D0BGD0_9AGAM|nr:hypothetical protein CY34DRAFT_153717 [Suillus luteus UH-Slu-Lm8-n1]
MMSTAIHSGSSRGLRRILKPWVSGRRRNRQPNIRCCALQETLPRSYFPIPHIVALTPCTRRHQSPSFSLKTPSSPHSTLPHFFHTRQSASSKMPTASSRLLARPAWNQNSSSADEGFRSECTPHCLLDFASATRTHTHLP